MSKENPQWGASRIHGELLMVGFEVAQSTVSKYMVRGGAPPSQSWKTFLRNHAQAIAAIDLCVVPTLTFERLFAFLVLGHGRRQLVQGDATQFRVRTMGIRDRPILPRPPWQNAYVERLIGTVRRECLDRMLIVGESHLRRVLASYAAYYNQARTHLALQKDAPLHRAVQRSGVIVAIPILAGLHHQYVRK
jgi:Integrase core domain